MLRIIDKVGFRTSSTTYGIIEKYLNLSNGENEFIMTFTNDFNGDDIYYLNSDISIFFSKLKKGSSLVREGDGKYTLQGKKLLEINEEGEMYILERYNNNPLIMPDIKSINLEPTNISLLEIFKERWGAADEDEDDYSFLY